MSSVHDIVIAAVNVSSRTGAWDQWWLRARQDVDKIETAFIAAILSLGAPPHPEFLTNAALEDALENIPRIPLNESPEDRRYRIDMKNDIDRRWKAQRKYNNKLNCFAVEHGFRFGHSTWDPAQFRKLFAEWLKLHACKEGQHG